MKIIIALFFAFIPVIIQAQNCGIVIDRVTNGCIPYANISVENSSNGVIADSNGVFNLPLIDIKKSLIISAIGYESAKVKICNLKDTVILNPVVINLPEVNVLNSINREIKIGKLKEGFMLNFFSCSLEPWKIARFFPYKEKYRKTPYIKTVELMTLSKINNAKFEIKLYAKDKDGKPTIPLTDVGIYGFALKGYKATLINLDSYNIVFPKDGLFISIEWISTKGNKNLSYCSLNATGNACQPRLSYEPSFAGIRDHYNNSTWVYKMEWLNDQSRENTIQMRLTLSN